jgi:hypothetical protein
VIIFPGMSAYPSHMKFEPVDITNASNFISTTAFGYNNLSNYPALCLLAND